MIDQPFKFNKKLIFGIVGTVLEGLLSGCNFLVLFKVLELIFGNNIELNDIFWATGLIGIILLLRLVLYIFSYTGSQIGGSSISRNIRIAIGDKLKKIPLSLFTKNKTGYYINAATSEVGDYEQILTHKMADIVKYTVLVLAVDIYVINLLPSAGIVSLLAGLLIIPSMVFSIKQVKKYGVGKNLAREKNVSNITEYLVGSQTLRSYGLVGKKNSTLTKTMKTYSNISYNYEKSVLPIGFTFAFASHISLGLAIILSTKAFIDGNITESTLLIIVLFILLITKVHLTLYISMLSFKNLGLSKSKIQKIFSEKEEEYTNIGFTCKKHNITFKNIQFAYEENEPVLRDVSFNIKENTLTAIVGDSGSGKSTILNLISKYYIPQAGSIYLGDTNTEKLSAEQVLSEISMVDQDVFLFNDSIRNNIRYARPEACDREIEQACKLANCDGFIREMEKGYDTEVGENGNKLSGGQRQRISIARAILKNSPIILLDEATASLDIENELLVKQAITNLLSGNKTVIMIAHTLPIIRNADQILVLNNGVISESGTHDDLLKMNGKYAAMWEASSKLK